MAQTEAQNSLFCFRGFTVQSMGTWSLRVTSLEMGGFGRGASSGWRKRKGEEEQEEEKRERQKDRGGGLTCPITNKDVGVKYWGKA